MLVKHTQLWVTKRSISVSKFKNSDTQNEGLTSTLFMAYISETYLGLKPGHPVPDIAPRYGYTVKPVYNDHLIGYFSAFWSSARWPRAT